MNARAAKKMAAAREDMISLSPFWGALALRLALVEDPTCRTGWTDGVSLGYSAEYVNAISHDQCVFLVAHETCHCAFGHPWRRDGRDHFQYNVATDLAINSELARHGFKLPESQTHESFVSGGKGVLLDPLYDGRSAEWIYDRTANGSPESEEEPGAGMDDKSDKSDQGDESGDGDQGDESGDESDDQGDDGDGSGEGDNDDAPDTTDNASGGGTDDDDGDGDDGDSGRPELPGEVRDAPIPSDDAPGITEADWRRATNEAALTAKARGNYGGDIARVVNAATEAKVDWIAVLRRFVQEIASADYSWTRANPRYAPLGIYLPALRADGLGPMVIAIDTSGSVDDVQLSQMEAESRAIIAEANPVRTTVMYCDTRVTAVETFERGEPVTLTAKGGGGTDFRPVFAHVETMDEAPACLAYLTDLAGVFPDAAPDYPVLWVHTGRRYRAATVPFGEVVAVR